MTISRPAHSTTLAILALFLLLFCSGCTQSPPGSGQTPTQDQGLAEQPQAAHGDDDHHDHVAPHGGALNSFMDEDAHLEVVLNPETGEVILYILDGTAKPGYRISGEQEVRVRFTSPIEKDVPFKPVADPLTGETEEDTSRFSALVEELKGQESFEGVLESIDVRDKTYSQTPIAWPVGTDDHPHDHDHDHDHDHHDDDDDHDDHDHHDDHS